MILKIELTALQEDLRKIGVAIIIATLVAMFFDRRVGVT